MLVYATTDSVVCSCSGDVVDDDDDYAITASGETPWWQGKIHFAYSDAN